MKKLLSLFLVLAIGSSVYYGCKKGPEDPFFSIKSRQQRMVGKWKCTLHRINGEDTLNTTWSKKTLSTGPCGDVTDTYNFDKDIRLTIGKDGRYDWITKVALMKTTTYENPTANPPNCETDVISLLPGAVPDTIDLNKGLWQFVGSVGAIKSKEQIVFVESADGVLGSVWSIVKCSSKEMKLSQSYTDFGGVAIKEEYTFEPDTD
jgi:hypothetical protein